MLEKLAEMVRDDAFRYDDFNDLTLHCLECDFKPILGQNCRNTQGKDCPLLFNREEKKDFVDGSLMLARWAVLLVAKGLGIHREDDKIVSAPGTDYRLLCLIVEAEEAGE